MTSLSVILCTYNPNPQYLERALLGLAQQTLAASRWDFVMVDNASTVPLIDLGPLRTHPKARIVREDNIGLLNARLTGFRSTSGTLAVLVDDDNVLDPNYLATALDIADQWPILGAWGGQCHPDFEEAPQDWTRPYWNWIAIREFDHDRWSNLPLDSPTTPCGAGMCVRRCVLDNYLDTIAAHPLRTYLGRSGTSLAGGEDTDICLSAATIGLGTGQFAALHLSHIIPKKRLTESYLASLLEAMTFTGVLQRYIGGERPPANPSRSQKLLEWYQARRISPRDRRFQKAKMRGAERAQSIIRHYESSAITTAPPHATL